MLAGAADLLAEELPADRSPWAATLVTDLGDGATAIVVRFHHELDAVATAGAGRPPTTPIFRR